MEKILNFGTAKQKRIISECVDLKVLSCFIQEIESEMSQVKTYIKENQIKYSNGDDTCKNGEWYQAMLRKQNYLVRLKYTIIQRNNEIKIIEKAACKAPEKQTKKLAEYFMQIARDKLDSALFNEIVNEAKIMKQQLITT